MSSYLLKIRKKYIFQSIHYKLYIVIVATRKNYFQPEINTLTDCNLSEDKA